MTDYTISFKLSNETVYACYRGRFWRWDGSFWKESHLMTQKFERAKAADKKLTPQAFLTNSAEFAPLDEYEIDCAMLDALENAKPCKNAPIEPVEEESSSDVPASCICSTCTCGGCKEECFGNCRSCGHPVQECNSYQTEGEKHLTPAHSEDVAEPLGNIPADSSFDFSALGDLSEQAVETDQQFDLHYGTAQDEYLISCIYVAKMHALTAKAGRYGGGTWTKWYESKGMSKSSVWNMLQTGEGFKGSTVEQLTSIPELSHKDLNLIARSGCAEQLTAAAGDSQRVQELLAQLKAEKDRADKAEAHLEAANADINGLAKQNAQLKERANSAEAREEEAWKMQSKAEARAKNAEGQLSGSRQVAEAAKLRADKLQEENAALKKQPIAAVVDEEEVDRRAGEKAYEIAAGMTADYKAQQEQDARDAYDSIILAGRSITSIVQSAKMQFRKLPNDQRETAINQFVHTLASAQGEVSACL
nr:MAG TPA: STOP protein [Caudoviricetes sp.]